MKPGMKEAETLQKRRRDIALSSAFFLASLAIAFLLAKALWTIPLVFLTVYFVCDYLLSFAHRSSALSSILVACLLTYACWSLLLKVEYHEQQAALTEGDLEPLPSDNTNKITLQIGSDGPKLVRDAPGNLGLIMPLEQLKIAYDAGLKLEMGTNGLEISTPVIDRDGSRVGEIVSNHWKVYPPYCSDKNYNKNSLEIKDKAGHVVLQVVLFKNAVQLQGEWHTYLGSGERLESKGGFGATTVWFNPEDENKYASLIQPMFSYPSSQHWGELLLKQP